MSKGVLLLFTFVVFASQLEAQWQNLRQQITVSNPSRSGLAKENPEIMVYLLSFREKKGGG